MEGGICALKATRAAGVTVKGTDRAGGAPASLLEAAFLPETLNKTRSLGAHM